MKLHSLRASQVLPIPVSEAWDFFSDPRNLSAITPAWLNFTITSEIPERVYAGLIITYRITPLFGVPSRWVTEITHVREPYYFVDEQRFGPYRFWHHQHHFREIDGGTLAEDSVHYALPFGAAGRVVNRLLIARRLKEIFAYRRRILAVRFPSERISERER